MHINNKPPIETSQNTTPISLRQAKQDKYQKIIDTSPYIVLRAFAAIGKAFNNACHSIDIRINGGNPLKISHYIQDSSDLNKTIKISNIASDIRKGVDPKNIKQRIDAGETADSSVYAVIQEQAKSNKRFDYSILVNEIKPSTQKTILMMLANGDGSEEDISDRIAAGAKVDIQSPKDGRTALSFACEAGNLGAVKALLKNNANIHLQDNTGKTPLMYAQEQNRREIIELLHEQKT